MFRRLASYKANSSSDANAENAQPQSLEMPEAANGRYIPPRTDVYSEIRFSACSAADATAKPVISTDNGAPELQSSEPPNRSSLDDTTLIDNDIYQ